MSVLQSQVVSGVNVMKEEMWRIGLALPRMFLSHTNTHILTWLALLFWSVCLSHLACLKKKIQKVSFLAPPDIMLLLFGDISPLRSVFRSLSLLRLHDSASKRAAWWTRWRSSVWATTSSALTDATSWGRDTTRSPACSKSCPKTSPSHSNWSSRWRPSVSFTVEVQDESRGAPMDDVMDTDG